MTRMTIGLLVGVILGLAAAAGGLLGFLLTVVFGAIGLTVGAWLDGVDLTRLSEQLQQRRPPRG